MPMNSTEKVAMMRKAKSQLQGFWLESALATLIYVLIIGVASSTYVTELLLAGPLMFGYVLFIAGVADTRRADLNLLFKGFNRFVETLVAGLLYTLAVSIGFALLIVPGIILSTGFAFTFFIMAEDANISGVDALKKSWQMTRGLKWDIFCLWLRFFGWALLCLLTLGIGYLWLNPYITATTLNYYRQVKYGTY